jgi:hypothetical protein
LKQQLIGNMIQQQIFRLKLKWGEMWKTKLGTRGELRLKKNKKEIRVFGLIHRGRVSCFFNFICLRFEETIMPSCLKGEN